MHVKNFPHYAVKDRKNISGNIFSAAGNIKQYNVEKVKWLETILA
jgi:hypothetical protein